MIRARAAVFAVALLPAVARADTFDERAEMAIRAAARTRPNLGQHDGPHRAGRNGFWFAEARFATGDTAGALKILPGVLADADGHADAGGANGGFSLWPGMDCYVRWKAKMTPEIREAFKTTFTTCATYGKGATPNQQIMAAVACRLACEQWGEAVATSKSGITFRGAPKGDRSGRLWLMDELARVPRYNFKERWSKHYLWASLGPIRTLADLSTDPELRRRADMVWTWGVANSASTWLAGHWALPAGRGSTGAQQNRCDLTEFSWWLLFGGPKPAGMLDSEQSILYALPGAPRPPVFPEILEAATNRARPYVVRTMARTHETQFATSWVAPDHALFSQVEGDTTLNPDGTLAIKDLDNAGVPSNDWSSERWALVWDDAPAYGDSALWMRPPTSYGWAKGSGIGPYEDTLQHEGTLVGVLNIPDGKHQFTKDHIPTNCLAAVDEAKSSGRLFIHYRTVLVAIHRTEPFTWTDARSPCVKRGFAVETAMPSEYPQATPAERLAAFRAEVLAKGGVDARGMQADPPRFAYRTRKGRVLDLTYGQAGRIDGMAVDYAKWPLHEDPWIRQPQMGPMTIRGRDRTIVLDFDRWTISTNRVAKEAG